MDRLMVEVHQENRRVRETIFFMCAAFILAFKLVMTNVSYLSCFYASYILMKIACEYKITGLQFMQFLGIYVGFIIVGVIMVLVCVSDMLVDRQVKSKEPDENVYTENLIIDIYGPVDNFVDNFVPANLEQDFINNSDVVYPSRKGEYVNIERTNN
jgi:NADH:ubiquinone oxidoreductase subunit 6 (subunit J)